MTQPADQAEQYAGPMDLYPDHIATWSRARVEYEIRRRVQTAYLGEGVVLARILGRHKILLRGSDRGFACHVMLDGYWEMWLTQFLARAIRPGMTVIDVGANYGYYTLQMADCVGATGRVVAVEPNPEAVALLRESVLLNGFAGWTRVEAAAVSGAAGSAFLFAPDGEPKNAQLVSPADWPGGRLHEVPVTTLDALAADLPRVNLVKIDAEGAEEGVVAGMQGLIARDRPMVVLEYNAARYADPGGFLDFLLAAYGWCQELTGDGRVVPLDRASVIDPDPRTDRLLIFE